jgi:hypothetical protein
MNSKQSSKQPTALPLREQYQSSAYIAEDYLYYQRVYT